jgi:acyl-CoA thioester hydrolase
MESHLWQIMPFERVTMSMKKTITVKTDVAVRFNEADPLGIVWHGHYVRYFEDGRESFGNQFGCSYLDFYKNGFVIPIVKIDCDFKKSLRYGDTVVIETTFHASLAAKMIFTYNLYDKHTGDLVSKGSTTQVFLDTATNTLQLATPDFFQQWKKNNGFGAFVV